jgi:hypothetical protein
MPRKLKKPRELNKTKIGQSRFFQIILRDYLKQLYNGKYD